MWKIWVPAAFMLLVPVAAFAQLLSETQIEAAIACGTGASRCERPILEPGGFVFNTVGWEVQVIPPLGRIYSAAREAKEKYMQFRRAEVTDEMLAPMIDVRVRNTNSDMKFNPNVQHVVILPRGKKEGAVQPARISPWNYEAKNLAGASFTREGKAASFNIAELPPGELDIVVVVSDGYKEQRAGIGKSDRQKLDAWSGVSAR